MSRWSSFPPGRVLLPALLLAAVAACGCGGPKLVPVSGKVMLGNEPLTGGSVRYIADASKGNEVKANPTGQIGTDGTYTLSTDGKPGAPPGAYKVVISTMMMPPPGGGAPAGGKAKVPAQYTEPERTPLSVQVPGDYDLKLTK